MRPLGILVTGDPVEGVARTRGSFADLFRVELGGAWEGDFRLLDARRGELPRASDLAALIITGSPESRHLARALDPRDRGGAPRVRRRGRAGARRVLRSPAARPGARWVGGSKPGRAGIGRVSIASSGATGAGGLPKARREHEHRARRAPRRGVRCVPASPTPLGWGRLRLSYPVTGVGGH